MFGHWTEFRYFIFSIFLRENGGGVFFVVDNFVFEDEEVSGFSNSLVLHLR